MMTEKFEVQISPIEHYVKYRSVEYTIAIIRFDVVQNGVPFDNGYNGCFECCDIGLKELIEAADDFLTEKIAQNEQLNFVIPYVAGDHILYGYFFDIYVGSNPEDNYWEFKVTRDFSEEEERIIEYSCRLNREQVAALRESVACQFEAFDWDNCGKTEFFRFDVPDKPYEWCYSAKKLETTLNELLIGEKLLAVYVSGANYANPLSISENYVNYYIGSRVYLEFETIHADIHAHAEGLFEIRFFVSNQVCKTRFYDELEDPDQILCNTGDIFQLNYEGETIRDITVGATDDWSWDAKGFDKSKVGDSVELPYSLRFEFNCGSWLTLSGGLDDFMLKMEALDSQ